MSARARAPMRGVIVEDALQLTLVELTRACGAHTDMVVALVDEGVLAPSGGSPQQWRFGGAALRRARVALRLARDLELNMAGVALVLDLLDQLEALQAQLRRRGER